jgi:glycosyltransferase involved in cell wall biosynthesis
VTFAIREITDIIDSLSRVQVVHNNLKIDSSAITIVIPTFNAADFVLETLNQVRLIPNATIVVVDDQSDDKTLETILTILNDHPDFLVLKAHHRGSPGFARNCGISIAKTKWIWFLDCDDVPISNKLEQLLEIASINDSDVVIMNYLIRYDSNFAWTLSFDTKHFVSLCSSGHTIYANIIQEPKLVRLSPHPSRSIYKLEFLKKKHLRFDENENFEDGSFWPKMLASATSVMLWNWPQVVYRVRQNSITYSNEIGRKRFLISQFEKIVSLENFLDDQFRHARYEIFLYGIEMISWPLGELTGNALLEYKKLSRNFLMKLDDSWIPPGSFFTKEDKLDLFRTFLRFRVFKKAFKLWLY